MSDKLELYDLTVEYTSSPRGTPTGGLRFGWKLRSDTRSTVQSAYRLRIACERRGESFDSGWISSSASDNVVPRLTLPHSEHIDYTVYVRDNHGRCAEASSSFDTAPGKFTGRWIKPARRIDGWGVYFRHSFTVRKKVSRAMVYASGLGCGFLYLNGECVEENYLDAPYTNYEKEVLYRAYDVTALLGRKNAVGMHVGDGWYSQSRVWSAGGFRYGDVCAAVMLVLQYADGTEETINSDTDWLCKYSPVTLNNIHGGETYDERLQTEDWCLYDFKREGWENAVIDKTRKGKLKCTIIPPCREYRTVKPVAVRQLHDREGGVWVYDMGENFSGFVRLRPPPSAPGAEYVLRFAETVDSSGNLDTRSTGVYHTYVIQQDRFICADCAGGKVWSPRFTYHGFRYVELSGYYGRSPSLDVIEGVAINTNLRKTGFFTCSDSDFNRLLCVIERTILSNYHGFPEDCPVREKCGWLGDAQIVSDTALMTFDMSTCYEKYLSDIKTSREVYGDWTMIAPGKRTCGFASPLWGCAQVIIPYNLYKYTGNKKILRDCFSLMEQWTEHELSRSVGYIIEEGLGDWCPPVTNEGRRRIPVSHSSTLAFYEVCAKMAEICAALGRDGGRYTELCESIRRAFNDRFYDAENHTYGYQATNAQAYSLGICPDGEGEDVLRSLYEMIKKDRYVMTTGIYGNKCLLPLLFEKDRGEDAYKIMFGRNMYDFGTMLDDRGTSLWECPELRHIDSGGVASYNHPMHSGFAYTYYAQLAGIKPTRPGFAEFEIAPHIFSRIDSLSASYDSPRGKIEVSYTKRDGVVDYTVTVPPNTKCTLKIPYRVCLTVDGEAASGELMIGSGTYSVSAR